MSAAVAVDGTANTWTRFSESVVEGTKWIGRQIQWFFGALKDSLVRIYEFVIPYFQGALEFVKDKFYACKELIVRNKEISMIGGASAVIILLLACAFFWFPSSPEGK